MKANRPPKQPPADHPRSAWNKLAFVQKLARFPGGKPVSSRPESAIAASIALISVALIAVAACNGTAQKSTAVTEPKTAAPACDHRGLTTTLNAIAKDGASQTPEKRAAMIADKRGVLDNVITAAKQPTPSADPLDRLACAASGAIAAMMQLETPVGIGGQTDASVAAASAHLTEFAAAINETCQALATAGRSTEDARRCAIGKLNAATAPALTAGNAFRSALSTPPIALERWAILAEHARNWGLNARTAWAPLAAQIAALPGSSAAPDQDLVVDGRLTRIACDVQGQQATLKDAGLLALIAATNETQRDAIRKEFRTFSDAADAAASQASEALGLAPKPDGVCAPGQDAATCATARFSALNAACLAPWGVAPRPRPTG
jgi:hypothetical protein